MTTHELARELLDLPDIMVVRTADSRMGYEYSEIDSGWTEEIQLFRDKNRDLQLDGDGESFPAIVIR